MFYLPACLLVLSISKNRGWKIPGSDFHNLVGGMGHAARYSGSGDYTELRHHAQYAEAKAMFKAVRDQQKSRLLSMLSYLRASTICWMILLTLKEVGTPSPSPLAPRRPGLLQAQQSIHEL